MVENSARKDVLLDLFLPNNKVWEVFGKSGLLQRSQDSRVEFKVLCGRSKAISRTEVLDSKKANFVPFKNLISCISWARKLEEKVLSKKC